MKHEWILDALFRAYCMDLLDFQFTDTVVAVGGEGVPSEQHFLKGFLEIIEPGSIAETVASSLLQSTLHVRTR